MVDCYDWNAEGSESSCAGSGDMSRCTSINDVIAKANHCDPHTVLLLQ